MPIMPTTKSLFLCDGYTPHYANKVTLHGLFNSIKVPNGYPFVKDEFCVFAQLANGLGRSSIFVEIRFAPTNELVHTTEKFQVVFPNRQQIIQVAIRMQNCCFNQAGLYILNLYCDNQWMADTLLSMRSK